VRVLAKSAASISGVLASAPSRTGPCWAASHRATVTAWRGAARDLDQDTLDRRRRLLGQNHPDTLASASELAIDLRNLGQVRAARDLDQDTLDRRRRVLGEDHPDTLATANKLAADLRAQCDVDDEP
jgi:Tetratricopeptide repeat